MLSDTEILSAITSAESTALGGSSDAVQSDRDDAVKRYYGQPYGDELPGRSSVVSRDVADVVEGVVANVVKPLVGGDRVVQFDPRGPDDEAAAEQETDYVNFVALERNNGFFWLVSAIKDALLLRNGYVKAGWHVRKDMVIEIYQGQTEQQVQQLLEGGDVEIMQASPAGQAIDENGQPATLYDVKVRVTKPTAFVRLEPAPANECIVSERARSPSLQDDSLDFFQHRTRKTISDLRMAGYEVEDDVTDDDAGQSIEEQTRNRFQAANTWDDPTAAPERRIVLFKESYIRLDADGDGIAELRKVCHIGTTILANEECEIIPFACFSGVLVPHQHLGMSVYDLVQDLARIKTALIRSYLDNRNLQNNGRFAINVQNVNLDDLLTSRPGGVVRVDGDPSANIFPLVAPDTSTGALQGLEYLDTVREQRTGYTRNSAGIDNDALTNRTATGMSMQLSQSQLRLEMIARTIAETGARDVFRVIHALTLKHANQEEKVRLRGKWVTVNPREWVRRTDLSIAIGLGTGTPEQQLAKLMGLAPMLQQLAPLGLVGSEQAYNFASEAFKLSGYKAVDRFLKDPPRDPNTGQVQDPPPQPPEAVQVEQIRQQGKQQELQQNAQIEQQKLAMTAQAKDKEQQNALIVQQQNDQRDAQREQQKAVMDAQKQERDHALKREEMALSHALEMEKMKREFEFKYWDAEQNRANQRDIAIHTAAMKPQEPRAN